MRLSRRSFLRISGGLVGVALVAPLAACGADDEPGIEVATPTDPPSTATAEPTAPEVTPEPTPAAAYDPDLHLIVDKQHALPDGYAPADLEFLPPHWHAPEFGGLQLRAPVIAALEPMFQAASADGVELRIRSAYRSYEEQEYTFAYWVDTLGEEQARRESAEPGHSEHQLGTTMDFVAPENGWQLLESFADTTSGLWLAENAHRFGFALSYPRDGEEVTGYIFEPWHYRYVGQEAALAWHESGLTLVEFLTALQA